MLDFYGQGATFSKVDFLRLGGLFMITTTFQYHTFSQVLFDDQGLGQDVFTVEVVF